MKENVYKPIQKIGTDISVVFATLPLENTSGRLLTNPEKKSLIANGNIFFDFGLHGAFLAEKNGKTEQ